MALNKKLLRKVRNRIAKIPESYRQSDWVKASPKAPCGAAACLAGETIICEADNVQKGIAALNRMVERGGDSSIGVFWSRVPDRAAKLLGVSPRDAEKIFAGVPEWPEPFGKQMRNAKTPTKQATVAVAYLDECLKRGKVIW